MLTSHTKTAAGVHCYDLLYADGTAQRDAVLGSGAGAGLEQLACWLPLASPLRQVPLPPRVSFVSATRPVLGLGALWKAYTTCGSETVASLGRDLLLGPPSPNPGSLSRRGLCGAHS